MQCTFWFEVSKSLLLWEKQFLWLLHEIQITWNGISIASKFLALKSKPALLSEVIFFFFYIWSHLFLLSMVLINGRWRKNVCRTVIKQWTFPGGAHAHMIHHTNGSLITSIALCKLWFVISVKTRNHFQYFHCSTDQTYCEKQVKCCANWLLSLSWQSTLGGLLLFVSAVWFNLKVIPSL